MSQDTIEIEETLALADRAELGEKFTPEQLAEVSGETYRLRANVSVGQPCIGGVGYSPAHLAAAQLHGWTAHRMATSEAFTLTLEDYRAALAAVDTFQPHAPACSPYLPKSSAKTR